MKNKSLLTISSLLLTTVILSGCGNKTPENTTNNSNENVAMNENVEVDSKGNEINTVPNNQKEFEEIQEKQTEINELRTKLLENEEYQELQKELGMIFSGTGITIEDRKKAGEIQMKIREMEGDDIKKIEREIRILNEKINNPEVASHPKFQKLIEKQDEMLKLFMTLTSNEEYLKLDMEINELFKDGFNEEKQKQADEIQKRMMEMWPEEMKKLDKEIQELSSEIYASIENNNPEPEEEPIAPLPPSLPETDSNDDLSAPDIEAPNGEDSN